MNDTDIAPSKTADKHDRPGSSPPIEERVSFEAALSEQIQREKELTRHNDRVSAARRRRPMVEVDNYIFAGPDGPVALVDLFQDHYLLLALAGNAVSASG